MADNQVAYVSGLNIVMPEPHSPERYTALIEALARLKQPVKTRGDYFCVLDSAHYDPDTETVRGVIYRFFNLNALKDWYDLERQEPASREDVDRSVTVPDHLKPHMTRSNYCFFPKSHLLFFVRSESASSNSIGAQQIKRMFDGLFRIPKIFSEYGDMSTTILPEPTAIESILGTRAMRSLTISLKLPNPDLPNDDTRSRVFERMRRENAKKYVDRADAQNREDLEPDEERKALARVAAQHGYVNAEVDDPISEQTKPLSTKDKPLDEHVLLDGQTQTISGALFGAAQSLVDQFRQAEDSE